MATEVDEKALLHDRTVQIERIFQTLSGEDRKKVSGKLFQESHEIRSSLLKALLSLDLSRTNPVLSKSTLEIPKESLVIIIEKSKKYRKIIKKAIWKNCKIEIFNNASDFLRFLNRASNNEWIVSSDLVLANVNLTPAGQGDTILDYLQEEDDLINIPVIFIWKSKGKNELDHLKKWAVDFFSRKELSKGFEAIIWQRVAKQIRIKIVNQMLWDIVNLKTQELKITNMILLESITGLECSAITLAERMCMLAAYRDNETWVHIDRMSCYCEALAKKFGFSEEKSKLILQASRLHDSWKISTPDSILLKPWKLTGDEFDIMKKHTRVWFEILSDLSWDLFEMARNIALYHHEKYNGKGYPEGLHWEEIPIEARIAAICDVFDALTMVRPYKKAWTAEDAVALIKSEAGEHFDPALVKMFVEILPMILEIKNQYKEEAET